MKNQNFVRVISCLKLFHFTLPQVRIIFEVQILTYQSEKFKEKRKRRVKKRREAFLMANYAPFNVKPAKGGWGGDHGMRWGFDMFEKFGMKFPAYGQIIQVKCSQLSPTQAAHCS